MSQRLVITVVVFLFFFSSGILFWRNSTALDPTRDQGWWSVAFADPHDTTSLSFILENRSPTTTFEYQILQDQVVLDTGKVTVRQGEVVPISPSLAAHPSKRTIISVVANQKKQEIYR